MQTRLPPPLIFALAALIVGLLWKFAPALQWDVPSALANILGSVFVIGGLFYIIAALGLFKKKETTILPFTPEETTALVTDGVYSVTRNPMYLGMALVVMGLVIITRQPLGILALLAACAYLTVFQIKPEERALQRIFGQDYVDYKTRVRRWI